MRIASIIKGLMKPPVGVYEQIAKNIAKDTKPVRKQTPKFTPPKSDKFIPKTRNKT